MRFSLGTTKRRSTCFSSQNVRALLTAGGPEFANERQIMG